MKFGRLHDTRFPNIDNVDVYAYKNEFDYSRWVAGTKIKLCNVLWNSDYSDVALFKTNIERDRWFNELQDYYTIELESDHGSKQLLKVTWLTQETGPWQITFDCVSALARFAFADGVRQIDVYDSMISCVGSIEVALGLILDDDA